MPCYRCGTRQADPEPGKSSPWRRGVISEHQVLVCPACVSTALDDLSRCSRCGSAHLIRRLDQVECLDCRLIRDAAPDQVAAAAPPAPPAPEPPAAPGGGSALATEVARALDKVLGRR